MDVGLCYIITASLHPQVDVMWKLKLQCVTQPLANGKLGGCFQLPVCRTSPGPSANGELFRSELGELTNSDKPDKALQRGIYSSYYKVLNSPVWLWEDRVEKWDNLRRSEWNMMVSRVANSDGVVYFHQRSGRFCFC